MLRKLLPLPAAVISWVLVLIASLKFENWRVKTFCPDGMREGTVCYAEGWQILPLWLVCLGAMLSALAVVWVVALTAAGNRVKAASISFMVGTFTALGLGGLTDQALPALLSIAAGAVALCCVDLYCSNEAS
ncbi:hypothetical protein [Microbulbifer variabilis]|uniref:hypothetical protein n=1 Tax=Microbulbifer variabilis TaxID=266805 RepID=UPI001CFD0E22|nr:hypothetical protein [Microbulbifer variabilis]